MQRYLVANFKSHKNSQEVILWLTEVGEALKATDDAITVIVCPQFTALADAREFLTKNELDKKILLGSQDISDFGEGAFTGEVNAKTLAELVTHAIIGHSERRQLLHETKEDIEKKLAQANEYGIRPILCVSEQTIDEVRLLQDESALVAFEPPEAIGTGEPASTDEITAATVKIQQAIPAQTAVLYGGSVNAQTMDPMLAIEGIQGFLVGTACLDAVAFLKIYHGIRESERTAQPAA